MSPDEYKKLTYKIVDQLKERLPDSDIHILQDTLNTNSPMRSPSLLIGISAFKGSKVCEVYEVTNTGNEASWTFRGNTQI